MEAELRGDRKLVGTPVTLGNGEEWIVPSLPLNEEGEKIATMMDDLGAKEEKDWTLTDQMHGFFTTMYSILKVNYPNLTEEAAKEVSLFHMAMYSDFSTALAGGAQEPKNV